MDHDSICAIRWPDEYTIYSIWTLGLKFDRNYLRYGIDNDKKSCKYLIDNCNLKITIIWTVTVMMVDMRGCTELV